MSRESLDTARRVHEALSGGDVDGVIALCDPNFRLDMSDRVFNPAVYEGHHGIHEFLSDVREVWETFTWEPIEMTEYDEVVAVIIHSTGKARGSGLELDRRAAMLWEIEGGRAVSVAFYRDPEAALAIARGERDS
jgi:ketosteroid isomerase-like protein